MIGGHGSSIMECSPYPIQIWNKFTRLIKAVSQRFHIPFTHSEAKFSLFVFRQYYAIKLIPSAKLSCRKNKVYMVFFTFFAAKSSHNNQSQRKKITHSTDLIVSHYVDRFPRTRQVFDPLCVNRALCEHCIKKNKNI